MPLTPNQNVSAPAGFGGSKWGANGGAIAPVDGPLPLLANLSRGVRAMTFVADAKNNLRVQEGMSTGAIGGKTADQVSADDSTSQVWTADKESPGVADSQL